MVRQELPMSCGAACVRQLLLDAGIDVPESALREAAGFHADFGITLDGLRDAFAVYHPGAAYQHGTVWPEHLDRLASAVPFIALLRTPSRHFVIIDEVGHAEVRVRDPAGADEDPSIGAVAVMDRGVFLERWRQAHHGVIFRRE
ncbi:cysteine peptidase family C39 domain-containing protein [Sorangium sp. So ce854]|uniref:cysteine peptidase family C39 domain-containing protein n=1 Tax=Sorangium sp. So ce854 TaxID=3133322 RepID=UPI003F6089DA